MYAERGDAGDKEGVPERPRNGGGGGGAEQRADTKLALPCLKAGEGTRNTGALPPLHCLRPQEPD